MMGMSALPNRQRAATDPLSRALTLSEDAHAKAAKDPELDRGLSVASMGYAQVRGHAFLDREVRAGTHYRYRLAGIDGAAARRLERIADYLVFLFLGELVEHGPAAEEFANPRDLRTRAYLTGEIS